MWLSSKTWLGEVVFWIQLFTVISAEAIVPPKLNPLVFPSVHTAGMTARVSCTAYAGEPPLTFRWLKDGGDIPSGLAASSRQLDDYTSSLNLGPLEEGHVGNYTCIASNKGGTDASTAALFVKVPPSWISEPSDVSVQVGEEVQFPCLTSGSPKPQVTWTKTDQASLGTGFRWRVSDNGTMYFNKATKEDAGSYTCRGSNGIGDSLTKTVSLIVWVRPRVFDKFNSESVEKGKNTLLVCKAEGDEPLKFSWRKDKRDIREWKSLHQRVKQEEDTQNSYSVSRLYISTTTTQDAGVYSCAVTNDAGEDEMTVKLIVTEKPSCPVDLELSDFWSRDVRIRWSPPYTGSSAILEYLLEYWDITDPAGEHRNLTHPGGMNSLVINELNPATTYRARIWALNVVGASPPSEQIQFTTSEEEPSGIPTDVKVDNSGATFIRVSWKPPNHKSWNGQLQGFYVGYKSLSSNSPFSFYTAPFTNATNHYILRGLQKSSSYHVIVKAFNNVGTGPSSTELLVRTREGEAPPRPMLTIISVAPNALHLKATSSSEDFTVSGFTAFYRGDDGEWKDMKISRLSEENKFTITSLVPGKMYQIYLVSHGTFGDSEPSETVSIRTALPAGHQQQNAATKPNNEEVAIMQTMYIVIPVVIATVIIVAIVIGACLFVYYRRPPSIQLPYPVDLQKDAMMEHYVGTLRGRPKEPLCPYTPSQRRNIEMGLPINLEHQSMPPTQWSPQPSSKSIEARRMHIEPTVIEEEPIYESVMDEMRTIMRQRGNDTIKKSREFII